MKTMTLIGHQTRDGAGVKLFRVFANESAAFTDPFLLLDHFGSDDPADYIKGFPWHPHRGIETVTYMLEGEVAHGDSLGNGGIIGPGDLQWMSAGRGILHQEMPQENPVRLQGFQLWVNLPARDKMTKPRYRGVRALDIPSVKETGLEVKVIAGAWEGVTGPVKDLSVEVTYLDISLSARKAFEFRSPKGHTTLAYVFQGKGRFEGLSLDKSNAFLALDSARLSVHADEDLRFILASGKPLKEPIAWGGPIVMNSQEELQQAFRELDAGTFIKP